jgi:hypothetical protein
MQAAANEFKGGGSVRVTADACVNMCHTKRQGTGRSVIETRPLKNHARTIKQPASKVDFLCGCTYGVMHSAECLLKCL